MSGQKQKWQRAKKVGSTIWSHTPGTVSNKVRRANKERELLERQGGGAQPPTGGQQPAGGNAGVPATDMQQPGGAQPVNAPTESPIEDTRTTSIKTEATEQFQDFLNRTLSDEDLGGDLRKVVLDPRFIATVLTGNVYDEAPSFEVAGRKEKDGLFGNSVELVPIGNPKQDNGMPDMILTAFEDTAHSDDSKMQKGIMDTRKNLGLTLLAEAIRQRQRDGENTNDLISEGQDLVTQRAELGGQDRAWPRTFDEHQMHLLITTLGNTDVTYEIGDGSYIPSEVFYSEVRNWASYEHPGDQGRWEAYLLADLSKNRPTLGAENVSGNIKILNSSKVGRRLREEARQAEQEILEEVETLVEEILVTSTKDEVEGLKGTRGAAVPGLRDPEIQAEMNNEIGTLEGSFAEKEGNFESKMAELTERERIFNIKDSGGDKDNPPFAGNEKAEFEQEIENTKKELEDIGEGLMEIGEKLETVRSHRDLLENVKEETLRLFKRDLRTSGQAFPLTLAKNEERYCSIRNERIAELFSGLQELVDERESIDGFQPDGVRQLSAKEKRDLGGGRLLELEIEPESPETSPDFRFKKRNLETMVQSFKSEVDASEIPDELKNELKAFAESIKKTKNEGAADAGPEPGADEAEEPNQPDAGAPADGGSDSFSFTVSEIKKRFEDNKKRFRYAMYPVLAAVVNKANRVSKNQMLIRQAVYDGAEGVEKDEARPLTPSGSIGRAKNWLLRHYDGRYLPWFSNKMSFLKVPFAWVDGGFRRKIEPLAEDATGWQKFTHLARRIGYVLLWPWGSAYARSMKERDAEKGRSYEPLRRFSDLPYIRSVPLFNRLSIPNGWSIWRKARLLALGPTFLWTIPHSLSTESWGAENRKPVDNKFLGSFYEHGSGRTVRQGLVGALILTGVGFGPAAVGVAGTAYTMLDAPIRRAVVKSSIMADYENRIESASDEESTRISAQMDEHLNRIDLYVRAFPESNRMGRRDEGLHGWGLQGLLSDAWYHESFLADSLYQWPLGLLSGEAFAGGYNQSFPLPTMGVGLFSLPTAPLSVPSAAVEGLTGHQLYPTPVNLGWPLEYVHWNMSSSPERPDLASGHDTITINASTISLLDGSWDQDMTETITGTKTDDSLSYLLGEGVGNDTLRPHTPSPTKSQDEESGGWLSWIPFVGSSNNEEAADAGLEPDAGEESSQPDGGAPDGGTDAGEESNQPDAGAPDRGVEPGESNEETADQSEEERGD
jgi:hypothetical protein